VTIEQFVALGEAMAERVRPLLLDHFRSGVDYDVKADTSPVTIADRQAETTMRQMIERAWPEHGILGEEYGGERTNATYVWVLDPIDGTKSFVTGKPLFGTLIALLRDGEPIVGIIDMPALNERWVGAAGQPTRHNGVPVQTRSCEQLADAWLYATSPQMFVGGDAPAFERLRLSCYAAVYGADLYAYGLLARGRVDIVCEASLQPYDYCAVVPVVTGAGGRISDWQGRDLGLDSDGRVIAAGDGSIHAAALSMLNAVAPACG
jgi:inositol-phosphate phosphatase/L-galactose 1-phosphate phosphatase/histidinol-phosphatase